MNSELKNSILKTGTTILGIVCKDGVVMAGDRQSTLGGTIVANKKSQKVRQITDYLVISGTGSVSDIQRAEKILPAELKLKELRSKSRPSVRQASSLLASYLYSTIRQPSMIPSIAGFLVAGINEDGSAQLYSVMPDGGINEVEDYDANIGSGMPYVLGLLERQYKSEMSLKEGVELAVEAIKSSTQRDIGSGFGIDVFTISKDGIKKVIEQEILPDYKNSKKQ
ncbi:proteasome subunit beta [Candidatus Pacearchaeota archaeon]|nr:proteasome subunit beta [Candidatus Pacearchaeota archaeon]